MKAAIVLCSRLGSSRVPGKAIQKLNGEPLIRHLIRRLLPTKLPITLAVPPGEATEFEMALGPEIVGRIHIMQGWPTCPLSRMYDAATWDDELDAVVRVCTDKIFVDPSDILRFLSIFEHSEFDYLYSSSLTPGTGFEVIRVSRLEEAATLFNDVEHISYAIRAVTGNVCDVPKVRRWLGSGQEPRLLIDHPADVTVIEKILKDCGNDCTLDQVMAYLADHPEVARVNQLPKVTVYTCAYNADPWIETCLSSVAGQRGVDFEHLVVDDGSTDRTVAAVKSFHTPPPRLIELPLNRGLASASNVAIREARGQYLVRLDADDWFVDSHSLYELVRSIEGSPFDVIYPAHFVTLGDGTGHRIVHGRQDHHAGGAIFRARALAFMKFTDGLKTHDSYDLWKRANSRIQIGYLPRPIFYYRQHPGSLSKRDPEMRARVKQEIDREPKA